MRNENGLKIEQSPEQKETAPEIDFEKLGSETQTPLYIKKAQEEIQELILADQRYLDEHTALKPEYQKNPPAFHIKTVNKILDIEERICPQIETPNDYYRIFQNLKYLKYFWKDNIPPFVVGSEHLDNKYKCRRAFFGSLRSMIEILLQFHPEYISSNSNQQTLEQYIQKNIFKNKPHILPHQEVEDNIKEANEILNLLLKDLKNFDEEKNNSN